MDYLTPLGWEVIPFYCDLDRQFYRLSPAQLYSNTPSDFDFKLAKMTQPLSKSEFIDALSKTDIVLPVIHGEYGEGGELQEMLEKHHIPFVGSSSKSCSLMFDKVIANRYMAKHGFTTLPNTCIEENDALEVRLRKMKEFFEDVNAKEYLKANNVKRVVIKPSAGGSSIGVSIAENIEDAVKDAENIFINKYGGQALIEPYCKGREFTVIVLQNQKNEPVALIPTEIDLKGSEIFTYRNKYLPSNQVVHYCPPRFNDDLIRKIQKTAEYLFLLFEMRDFARLDGRVLADGKLIFSDFNPISGMEQHSNIFLQGSRIGFSHNDILQYIVTHAAQRYGIDCIVNPVKKKLKVQKIHILFGGETSERQVSVMSGTNVWLKLLNLADYQPSPYVLAPGHKVWELPYSFMLNYTIEEILTHCTAFEEIVSRLQILAPPICERLGMPALIENALLQPREMTLDQFCQEAANKNAFVFIALHGGEGENGTLQAKLNQYKLAYNGSDIEASNLCMDKYRTGKVLSDLKDPLLTSTSKILIPAKQVKQAENIWEDAVRELKTTDLLIKPQADGCSEGVVRLKSAKDLKIYLTAIEQSQIMLAAETLENQPLMIELPARVDNIIIEPFIVTDEIYVDGLKLVHNPKTGWIELTVGILEEKGNYHSLSPSITVVQGNVLSLEEKFQGGTGVNLTPPPEEIVTFEQIIFIKKKIEKTAKALGIKGYARIDIFFNTRSNHIIVIEANSLPGLTPSTVIYHQALAEVPPLTPLAFLSKLVELGIKRRNFQEKILPARTCQESN
jgi:D-alanine--D-alanine ligase